MNAVVDALVLLLVILGLGYRRAAPIQWVPIVAIILACITVFQTWPWWLVCAAWAVYLVIVFVTVVPLTRRLLLSKPVFHFFTSQLPPMSDTEKAAIEAGDTWWDKMLFSGHPHWATILATPTASLTAREQAFLDNEVNTLCAMLDEWQISHDANDLPQAVWDYIKQQRFFGLKISEEYGGLGFSELAHSHIIVKIATRSVSAAVTVMVPNSLGPAELLVHYGTSEQKQHYLPRLARGEDIPCFGLTGLDAGSDAGGITDTGVICRDEYQGKSVLGVRLNWNKRYITLAPVATLLGLAFKLSDPDHLLSDRTHLGITLALIPTTHPGVEHGNRHLPMHLSFMNGTSRGRDVFIPLDWLIGGAVMAGQGWRMLVECLSAGRAISLPAMSCASAQLCYRTSGVYAKIRTQFNQPIGYFEGVEESLALIGGYAYMMEAARQVTVSAIDQGIKPSVISAIVKYHTTEMSRHLVNNAMDIHAGRAIQMGPRNYLSYAYQAIPIGITVEGANILTRNLIIFGQGMIRCHPYLYDEMQAVADPSDEHGLAKFDTLISQHIGHVWSNLSRCLLMGVCPGIGRAPVKGAVGKYYKRLTRMSSALALAADVGIALIGGSLKRRERLSARYADILSYLYLSTTVLKYYQDNGHHQDDLVHVTWVLDHNLHAMGQAFSELCANFPSRWLGRVLKWIIFPWGCRYRKPSDKTEHALARLMLAPSPLRSRLTQHCFVPDDPNDMLGRMESAFIQQVACAHIIKKMRQGMGSRCVSTNQSLMQTIEQALTQQIITPEEAAQLRAYEKIRQDVLLVDEFAP